LIMSNPVQQVLFDQADFYDQGQPQSQAYHQAQPQPQPQQQFHQTADYYSNEKLQFYQTSYSQQDYLPQSDFYKIQPAYAHGSLPQGWLAAFGTSGYPDEPPLLEELGVNFGHIKDKTFTVLNPVRAVDPHIMDDADLAGPLLFCVAYAFFLLFSGKVHFGYIYGVAVLGCICMYTVLNLMSEQGPDVWRTTSVLGYCLLPMVGLSGVSTMYPLNDKIGIVLAVLAVLWCTAAASGMFVAALRMDEQRGLVAYPVFLLYAIFAIMTVF